MEKADIIVIGAGIVGLATAYRLQQKFPERSIVVLEKEKGPGLHQSGRNSGVLHSGIYYKPGSLKALNCRDGKKAMEAFCDEQGLPYERCGKVIVAVTEHEKPALHEIARRGKANGVACELISAERVRELEPHVAGVEGIHVPETGIVDFPAVCQRLSELIADHQANRILFNTEVTRLERRDGGVAVEAGRQGELVSRLVINCAGLQSDEMVEHSGQLPLARIIPFKGEYFELTKEAEHLCRTLIYPVPDPAFPFLGVHFTRMVRGGVECGPNAVPALGKEAYTKEDASWSDLVGFLKYSGTRKLFMKHWQMGLGEIHRSLSKKAFVKALQRLVPEIKEEHLVPAPCGIRAQAVFPDGGMVQDFLIQEDDVMIHVVNAPSPAATSALNIGGLIAEKVEERM